MNQSDYDDLIRRKPHLLSQTQFPAPRGDILPAPLPPVPHAEFKATTHASKDELKLNKLERRWLAELRLRNVACLGIQAVTLKLGDDCRYSPDFTGIEHGVLTAWETKGPFFRDDAKVKLKVAARAHPYIRFVLVQYSKPCGWSETLIHP